MSRSSKHKHDKVNDMKIHKLSVDYYCSLCNTHFKSHLGTIDMDFEDLPRRLDMKSCMSCDKQGGLKVTHASFEEIRTKEEKPIRYVYTIKCLICGASWNSLATVPHGKYFVDIYADLLKECTCITPWCTKRTDVTPMEYVRDKHMVTYRRVTN